MHFSFLTKTVLCTLAVLGQVTANDPSQDHEKCENGPFASDSPRGGDWNHQPGDPAIKCHSEWPNGEVITGMHVWRAKSSIKAIRFKYSKRGWASTTHGRIDEYVKEDEGFSGEWSATDQVRIEIYTGKKQDWGPGVARIVVTHNDGRPILDVGSDDKYRGDLGNPGANMGGGLVLAVKADAGAKVHYLEFRMLKSKVKSAKLVDVKMATDLETLNKKQEGMENVDLETIYFVNGNPPGGSNMTYNQGGETEVETYEEITTEQTNEWGGGVSVTVGASVGIPVLSASVETTYHAEYKQSKFESKTQADGHKKKFTWNFDCDPETPLPPQKAAKCSATTVMGAFEGAYEGTVETVLEDGSQYNVMEKGTVKSMTYADRVVKCETIDIKDVPGNAAKGEVKEVKNEEKPEEEKPQEEKPEEEQPKEEQPEEEQPAEEQQPTEEPTTPEAQQPVDTEEPATQQPAVEDPNLQQPQVKPPAPQQSNLPDSAMEEPVLADPSMQIPTRPRPQVRPSFASIPDTINDDPATQRQNVQVKPPAPQQSSMENPSMADTTMEDPSQEIPTRPSPYARPTVKNIIGATSDRPTMDTPTRPRPQVQPSYASVPDTINGEPTLDDPSMQTPTRPRPQVQPSYASIPDTMNDEPTLDAPFMYNPIRLRPQVMKPSHQSIPDTINDEPSTYDTQRPGLQQPQVKPPRPQQSSMPDSVMRPAVEEMPSVRPAVEEEPVSQVKGRRGIAFKA